MNFFRNRNADPLNADVSAGMHGTRIANNMPLFIGLGLFIVFIIVFVYVMNQRSNNTQSAKEEVKQPSGTTQFAKDISFGWVGLIPSDVKEAPAPAPVTENTDEKKEPNKQLPELKTDPVVQIQPDDSFEDRERIRNARFQAFEAGLKSRTAVEVTLRNRPNAEQVRADARTKLNETRQTLASTGDPSAAYQARLAQLRGELPAQSGFAGTEENTGNDLNRFNRNGKWELGTTVEAPSSPYQLRAGFVIPAIMLSGINSNLPGQVMAQVSQPVYDTATGRFLLIPQGTRLIGTYSSDVGYGQERVLMAWQRLIFPDGRALDIQAMPGSDSAGYAGFSDEIDNHYVRTFSSAFLLSGVIAAVSMSQDSGNSDSGNQQRASDSLSEALGQTLGQTMAQLISKNLNIAPTLQIRPGYRFNVMVTKDITFENVYEKFKTTGVSR